MLSVAQAGSLSYHLRLDGGVYVLLACSSPTTSSARTAYQEQLHLDLAMMEFMALEQIRPIQASMVTCRSSIGRLRPPPSQGRQSSKLG